MTYPVSSLAYKRFFHKDEWLDVGVPETRDIQADPEENSLLQFKKGVDEWINKDLLIEVKTVAYQTDQIARVIRRTVAELALSTGTTHYLPKENSVAKTRFETLAKEWKRDTIALSSWDAIVLHPSHLKIIGLGSQALSWILADLQENGGLWFVALESISGENPVPEQMRGRTKDMKNIWLKWGQENGYISDANETWLTKT
ncbi:MAG TPA: hypothetical protein VF928_06805 [Usitatibacteraceae bacterium]